MITDLSLFNQPIVDADSMMRLAAVFAARSIHPTVIYLHGPLGIGKSTFARGFIQYFLPDESVTSPTFTIMESYTCPQIDIYHLDCYRFESPEEALALGLDGIDQQASMLIEWPEKAQNYLPKPTLSLFFSQIDEQRYIRAL